MNYIVQMNIGEQCVSETHCSTITLARDTASILHEYGFSGKIIYNTTGLVIEEYK